MEKIKILDIDCCGCSACAVACPKNAISMDFNGSGSYRPVIDGNRCVGCHMCEKVCTVLNADSGKSAQPISKENVYISVVKDKSVLERSSSGGIGYILAKKAVEQGMTVCGVTYSAENERAEHIVCGELSDLEKIQGSKYLQSANEEAFRTVLTMDKGVIFGTPCQIAGADTVLRQKNKRDAFILVDIFCHGVPNQLLWNNHLKWLKSNKKIKGNSGFVFRQGKLFKINTENYSAWYNEDAFYTFFLRGWLYNKSCYNCNFRRNSCADIRLGDCMVPKYEKLSFSPSCVIANTAAGADFLESCYDELEIYREDYSVVDSVQEKDNLPVPEKYEERLAALKNGSSPEELIHDIMVKGRIKSLLKNRILGTVKSRGDKSVLSDFAAKNESERECQ